MLAGLARFGGVALRAFFALLVKVRRPRPVHAQGLVLTGTATWLPGRSQTGVAWVDDPPAQPLEVTGRFSRAIGLPQRLPDILGLALRFDVDGRSADLELSSTGQGVPSRFLLLPHRSPSRAWFGTLLPYRSPIGPLLIGARFLSPTALPAGIDELADALRAAPCHMRLYVATATSRWHPFADVDLRCAPEQDDEDLRFDAVRHPLPGTGAYEWARLLREPSYRLVQRT